MPRMNLQILAVIGLAMVLCPSSVECLFNRATWGARVASSPLPKLEVVSTLIVVHSTNNEPCTIPSGCKNAVRDLQIKAMANNQSDIPYNFVIGCCSGTYEGTGWDRKSPASMKFKNSINIALMGKFNASTVVPIHMGTSLRNLISEALLRNKLKKPYIITDSGMNKPMLKNFLKGFAEYKEFSPEFLAPPPTAAPATRIAATNGTKPAAGAAATTSKPQQPIAVASTPKPKSNQNNQTQHAGHAGHGAHGHATHNHAAGTTLAPTTTSTTAKSTKPK